MASMARLVEHPSPLGVLLLVACDGVLTEIVFEEFHDEAHQRIAQQSPDLRRASEWRGSQSDDRVSSEVLDEARRELDEYFAGQRRAFDLALSTDGGAGFRAQVQRSLNRIRYGETATYGMLAAMLEHPRAARAVGTACATNPLPIVQPCHRVVSADGTLGGYSGGLWRKELLLRLEAGVANPAA